MRRAAALVLAVIASVACVASREAATNQDAVGLSLPVLPDSGFVYSPQRLPLPRHYLFDVTGSAFGDDNTPADNPTTDAGAALGRVLFYDRRLSATNRIACASCHRQEFGFSDTARFSPGVSGALTRRHTMALVNARFYRSGRFFRDERAATLEQQTLLPIQDSLEMALPLGELIPKLEHTSYYPPLFARAFGTPEITADRVAHALAQFVRRWCLHGRASIRFFVAVVRPTSQFSPPRNARGDNCSSGARGARAAIVPTPSISISRTTSVSIQ